MTDFMLIDLDRQAGAVADYVKGWKPEDVLAWLRQYGDIQVSTMAGETRYCHTSRFGFRGYFYFTENGEFVIWRSGWLTY